MKDEKFMVLQEYMESCECYYGYDIHPLYTEGDDTEIFHVVEYGWKGEGNSHFIAKVENGKAYNFRTGEELIPE